MLEVNLPELLKFIAKAHRHTYAAPPEVRKQHRVETPILPGHKDYHFTDGVWAYHDSYSDSPNAPGREVVFLNDKPVWTMAYHGDTLQDITADERMEIFFQKRVFPFLREALMNFDDSIPFRGPAKFDKEPFRYTFEITGNYQLFSGIERVQFCDKDIFSQRVLGGLA